MAYQRVSAASRSSIRCREEAAGRVSWLSHVPLALAVNSPWVQRATSVPRPCIFPSLRKKAAAVVSSTGRGRLVGQHRCNKKDSSTTVLLGVVGSTAIFLFSFVFFLPLLAQTPTLAAWLGPPQQRWNPLLRAASVSGHQVGRPHYGLYHLVAGLLFPDAFLHQAHPP